MTRATMLLIGYCIFFTLCNILVFAFYYLYGYYFERKLRKFDTCVDLPENLLVLFKFKGIYGTDKIRASRGGSLAEFAAIAYFFIMELVCFAIVKIANDTVFPCRFAFLMFAVMIISGIVRVFITNHQIHRNIKETDIIDAHLFVEEVAVDKQKASIEDSDIFKEDVSKEMKIARELDALWEQDNDHENETADADEGKAAIKTLEEDVIGDNYAIETGEDFSITQRETVEDLSAFTTSDKGVYTVERDLKAEFAPAFINPDDGTNEADDFSLGKEFIDKKKKDIIGNDYTPVFDDSDVFD